MNEVDTIDKNMILNVTPLETRKRRLSHLMDKVNDVIELSNNLA